MDAVNVDIMRRWIVEVAKERRSEIADVPAVTRPQTVPGLQYVTRMTHDADAQPQMAAAVATRGRDAGKRVHTGRGGQQHGAAYRTSSLTAPQMEHAESKWIYLRYKAEKQVLDAYWSQGVVADATHPDIVDEIHAVMKKITSSWSRSRKRRENRRLKYVQ